MKFLLFIDKIYSKIILFFWILTLISILLSVFLYSSLPNIIPIHFHNNFQPDEWGNKLAIFLLPIGTLFACMLSSMKKYLDKKEPSLLRRAFAELVFIFVFVFWYVSMSFVVYIYFKLYLL